MVGQQAGGITFWKRSPPQGGSDGPVTVPEPFNERPQ